MTKIRTRTKTGSVKAVHNPSSLTRDSDSDQAVSNNIINLIRPRMNNSCIRPVKVIRGKSVDDKTISISINSTNNLNSNPSSDDDFYLRQLHHQHLRQPSTNLNNAPSHATYRLDHQPGAHQSEPAILPVTSTHSSLLLSSSSSTTAAAIITTAARERRAESASNTHNHQSNALFHPNSQLRPSEQTIPTQFLLPSHHSKHHYNHPHPLNQTYRPSCVLSDTLEIKQQQHPPQRPSRKKFNLLSRPGSSANQSTLQAIQSFLPSPNQLGSALQNLQINLIGPCWC
ncbi:expressed protein [Phakopsora pachyrhizi]|uniref:Expressed protein n=1 Tax=Phakopsora pachyrhizi TaxID=170000 RepID=A0AAV0AEV8_PHAPC|nr:expressed protein [Phakopsora pachyrhizi]